MKNLIFDSSALITLSMNNLLDELERLKNKFKGKFLITKAVEYETILRPLGIKKYELGALKVKELLKNKVIEISEHEKLDKETQMALKLSNHVFSAGGEWLNIIQEGEASCLALGKMLKDSVLVVDERTTRLLGEDPEKLRKILSRKLHTDVKMNNQNLDFFKNFKFLRTSELMYVAYKKGLIDIKDGTQLLDALLYGVKYKGCAISSNEIEEIKRL